MRTQPAAQQRPEPFHRIHMDFTQAVAIVIACELTPSMVDMLMTVAPGLQTGINAVFIRINKCTWINQYTPSSNAMTLESNMSDKSFSRPVGPVLVGRHALDPPPVQIGTSVSHTPSHTPSGPASYCSAMSLK